MKQFLAIFFLLFSIAAQAQDAKAILKQATELDKQLKAREAFEKYKEVLSAEPNNIAVLVRCTEFNCGWGSADKSESNKKIYFQNALDYASRAVAADSNNADANYARALAAAKMTELDIENKIKVDYVRQTKTYADKALAINPKHGKANYIVGRWHFEVLTLSWAKKAAVKVFYGGLAKPDIDTAIAYMEKCRTYDQYFIPAYLDLAKAYNYNNQPAKSIELLQKMAKLPNRNDTDAALKEEGSKMLEKML